MNTCDKCTHYLPDSDKYGINKLHAIPVNNDGSCSLMGDINQRSNPVDSCSGWDSESYGAGVYVGPKFGCIHWIKKGTV